MKKNKDPEVKEPMAQEVDAAAEPVVESDISSDETVADTPAPAVLAPEEEALEHRLLRLQADFDNYRKRTLRERMEWGDRAVESLVQEMLTVLDHYEIGLKVAEKHHTDKAVLDGFRLVYDQLLSVLGKVGLTPIDAEGALFDHNEHEALTHMPSEEHPADQVIAQTRRGYRLGHKLLRAAQVVVSSGPANPSNEE